MPQIVLRQLLDAFKVTAELIHVHQRDFLIQTGHRLAEATPKRTWKATNSWFISPGIPKTKEIPDGNYVGFRPDFEQQVAKYTKRNHTRWFISNTAPYISDLNFGSSRKAPAYFIDDTIAAMVAVYNHKKL
jgi:hypothetical protein